MISDTVVELSRWQFAITVLYHFLFVPLTLGLSALLAIMESVYVMTGNPIYKQMVKFWGKLFGINFALGVATGITMEFQFGTNWSYYSQYVGDVFGTPLAIEGLMAFFLESTFVGLFFFGWERLSKVKHLMVTWLVALGSNLSALWILVANGWMQYPVGAHFNAETHRMELDSFIEVFFNPVAQVKFVHTVSAGYVTGACFVLGISAWYLINGRHRRFALRSYAIAAAFGLASVLSVITLGDESGYEIGHAQKVKHRRHRRFEEHAHRLRDQGAVDDGPDRDPFDRQGDPRPARTDRRPRGKNPQRHQGLCGTAKRACQSPGFRSAGHAQGIPARPGLWIAGETLRPERRRCD